jgi:aconitate hydratase
MLRQVGRELSFFGPGVSTLPLADRATIGNMAPEYGATIGIFPVDQETLRYLEFTGRPAEQVKLVEAYMKEQGLFHTADAAQPAYSDTLELNLATVEPSMAGPRRPQDRVGLREVPRKFAEALPTLKKPAPPPAAAPPVGVGRWEGEGGQTAVAAPPRPTQATVRIDDCDHVLQHGAVVIAAITSCTNTSNPSVMVAAGLMAKKAVERGLRSQPWVKTSLAPGSKVVTDYLEQAGLMKPLEALRFHLVGYGCTTCIGNSGPLPEVVSNAVSECELVVCAVLSGNRNFEGRIQQDVRANYLASPPLVVAYALAGRIDIDFHNEPLGTGSDGKPVFMRDIWPSSKEVAEVIGRSIQSGMFRKSYAQVFDGDERWRGLPVPGVIGSRGSRRRTTSRAPYFDSMPAEASAGARTFAEHGSCACSATASTDHISPAVNSQTLPAGRYLVEHGVAPID